MDREDLSLDQCPRCLSPQVRLVTEPRSDGMEVYVRCEACGLQGDRCTPYEMAKRGMGLPDAFDFKDAFDAAIDDAIEAWNISDYDK